MHQHTKFGCKRLHVSEHTTLTIIDILHLHCDFDLDNSNPLSSQDTQAYDEVPSKKVWLQKDPQFRGYSRNGNDILL